MAEKHSSLSLSQELALLDEKLVALLISRSGLLAKAASSRRAKNMGITDPNQEKRLWSVWREASRSAHFDPQILKRLFHLINNLSYALVEKNTASDRPLCLFPRRKPVEIELDAPRDQILQSIMFFLGATSSAPLTVTPFQANDIALELINALNLCGFSITFQNHECTTQPTPAWSMDNKVIYAGQSKFHFYLLLCLALGQVTRAKFTGSTKLKIHDVRPVQELLPVLGARLTTVEPHSNGLPVRLEASGQLPSTISIPQGISKKFVLALCVAATTYPGGLIINLDESFTTSPLLRKGIAFLQDFFPEMLFENATLTIPPTPAHIEHTRVDVPVDPLMSLHLLSMPFFNGGTAVLHGRWPAYTPHLQDVVDILFEFGLRTHIDTTSITTSMGQYPAAVAVDITCCQEYLPLILAMGLGLKKECVISLDSTDDELEHAQDLLETLSAGYALTPGQLRLGLPPTKKATEITWQSPGPFWTLAGALVSFTYPGVCMNNADNISSVWPWFWKIFMNLPKPQQFLHPGTPHINDTTTTDTENDTKPKRKRIKVTGDESA